MGTKNFSITLPEDLMKRIDAVRGDIPRSRWLRRRAEEYLIEAD